MYKIQSIQDFNTVFFIGVAGTGMSAIAQYLSGIGKDVSGSDRYFKEEFQNETQLKLKTENIKCFLQDGSGIDEMIDLIVVSTAIEDSVPEVQKAKALNIPILKRSEVLALISKSKKTIAVGGTSGKSTTSAMIFDILSFAGMKPSIISGAGLTKLIKQGKIGNAFVGEGEWLVIEADESDGSIIQYHAEIGLLLNVDKDHKDIDVLMDIFKTFQLNSKNFIVNQSHYLAKKLSTKIENDFSIHGENAGIGASKFEQNGIEIIFEANNITFHLTQLGEHNMENAVAAISVCKLVGVDFNIAADALKKYEGIYRRHQIVGTKNGITLIDDYAHNPIKCAMSIKACQPLTSKVIAWFQPHGYGPTRFLKDDFIKEISSVLRGEDEIWMSEIFYAGGTAVKDISANDLIIGIKAKNKKAFFIENRNDLVNSLKSHLQENTVILLMGARDPSLDYFAHQVWNEL